MTTTPVPTRLGANWVALCAAHAKVRTLTDGKDPRDADAVADARQALVAIDETVAALDAYQALLSTMRGNLHSFIAHREVGL